MSTCLQLTLSLSFQILVGGQTGSTSVAPNPCCESGRAMVTDPVTGQAVFSCQQCDSHSLVYPRLGSSVPTSPYAPYSDQSYPAVGMESPTFYSSLVSMTIRPFLNYLVQYYNQQEKEDAFTRTYDD